MHVMIDIWLYSSPNVHLTIALAGLFTVHLCLACYFNLILYISFIICTHCLCTCTFPFYFTHSLGRFLTTLYLHVQIGCFYFFDQVLMSSSASRGLGVSFYSILVFLLLIYSSYFMILSMSHPVVISFLFYMISCVDIYMYCCSDIDLS